ncbi:GNAT family N-acetyltransferase (plasmid) [Streptomyces sp. HUAS TT11]|uniref:GNAT family N-acetyltransferase n=1 Tax=Streptomyces sp. HUAS TT11 TaxID=3447508 RepID=UPI003F65AAB5
MNATVPPSLAEQTEIKAYTDFLTSAPETVRDTLGIGSLEIGPALALAIREYPTHFFNRAGGFDTSETVTADTLEQIIAFYRKQGVSRGSFMIAPPMLPTDWASIAARLGLSTGHSHVKLGCDTETLLTAVDGIAALDPRWHIGLIEPHQAREWATVMMTAYGFTGPGMIDAASCVGKPNWRQYAVWDSEQMIAVGSIYINGECAHMFGAATLPAYRGRGAHTALLSIRAWAVKAAGCRWLVAETGDETLGTRSTSLHNLLGAGFQPLYERTTWTWRK